MSTTHELVLSSPFGTRVAAIPLETIEKLEYTLLVNAPGVLTLTMARETIADAYFVQDAQLDVWRKPLPTSAAHREADGPWLLEKNVVGVTANGKRYRTLTFRTANTLLARRVAMYYTNSSQVTISPGAAADSVMQSIVVTNLGASANGSPAYVGGTTPSRRIDTYLTVAAALATGPTIHKAFAWRSVLATLQEVARDAAEADAPVYFDIVAGGLTPLEFRTYIGVRGTDRSTGAARLVVSPERGSLGGTIEVTEDWTNTATWVVAGGSGQDAARVLGSAYDTARSALSPFGVREAFIDASSLNSSVLCAAEASAEMNHRRPKKVLTGTLLSVPGATYGVDWGFGDKLVAEFEGDSFVARVDGVTMKVEKMRETVTAAIRGET